MLSILRSSGSFSSRNARAPMFCRPMALSIPAAVSNRRGGGLPGHRLARKAFGHEAAEPAQGDDVFELDAIAEAAAGGQDRILEGDAGDFDAQVQPGLG